MKYYKEFKSVLKLPPSIVERTKTYLELSCNIVSWFKDNYELTTNMKDICKIKQIYDDFSKSNFFDILSKIEKQKYNKKYFFDYLENNQFFKKYYCDRYYNLRNILKGWIKIEDNNDDKDDDMMQ